MINNDLPQETGRQINNKLLFLFLQNISNLLFFILIVAVYNIMLETLSNNSEFSLGLSVPNLFLQVFPWLTNAG